MKTIVKIAITAVISMAAFNPALLSAEPAAPETQEKSAEPVKIDVVGTLTKDGDKTSFIDEAGKKYLVTKNNDEKVAAFIGKKVKISGQSKSKDGANGKPFHMIVYINKIGEAPKVP